MEALLDNEMQRKPQPRLKVPHGQPEPIGKPIIRPLAGSGSMDIIALRDTETISEYLQKTLGHHRVYVMP